MVDLSEECLNILNGGHFTVVEPGPLHTPIQSFSIQRDEKLLKTDIIIALASSALEESDFSFIKHDRVGHKIF